MRAEPPRQRDVRPRNVPYLVALLITAAAVVIGALSSLSYAINFNLGPLEGLSLDASGNLQPEPPIRVMLMRSEASSDARELNRWQELLAVPSLAVVVQGKEQLPAELTGAEVVVLPWGSRLTPEQADRLRGYLKAGGGVLAEGPVSQTSADSLLSGLFQVYPRPMPAGLTHPLLLHPVAGALLDPILPPGYPLKVNLEVLATAGLAVAKHPLATWTQADGSVLELEPALPTAATAQPDATPAGPSSPATAGSGASSASSSASPAGKSATAPPVASGTAAAIALGELGPGRTVWMGFPVSELFHDQHAGQTLQTGLFTLMRWLAHRPVARLSPRPQTAPTPVALAIDVDEEPGALELSERLQALHLRPTWLIDQEALAGHPALLARLSASGEVALRESPAFSSYTRADRRKALEQAGTGLPGSNRETGPGFATTRGGDGDAVRASLGESRVAWLLPEGPVERRIPVWRSYRGAPPLLVLPAAAVDLRLPDDSVSPLEQLQAARPEVGSEGWTVVRLSSHTARDSVGRRQLETLFAALARPDRFQVAPLGELVSGWKDLDAVRMSAQMLRPDRLHLRMTGGEHPLDHLRICLYLPTDRQPVKVITHHLRPARGELRLTQPGVLEIDFDRLAARRTQDFFIELARMP